MKIRINLLDGSFVEFEAEPHFHFDSFCMSIRESGRWFNQSIYIPHHAIASIFATGSTFAPTGRSLQ